MCPIDKVILWLGLPLYNTGIRNLLRATQKLLPKLEIRPGTPRLICMKCVQSEILSLGGAVRVELGDKGMWYDGIIRFVSQVL